MRQSGRQSKTGTAVLVWQNLRQTWRLGQAAAKAVGIVWKWPVKGLQELGQKSIKENSGLRRGWIGMKHNWKMLLASRLWGNSNE